MSEFEVAQLRVGSGYKCENLPCDRPAMLEVDFGDDVIRLCVDCYEKEVENDE